MSRKDVSAEVVRYWLGRAREALASARDEQKAGRHSFAVNRCYYAAFYATSAILLSRGHHFVKHSGVRSGLHRHLIKTGILAEDWGKLYDQLFAERQQGDYVEFVTFDAEEVARLIHQVNDLVSALERLSTT